MVEKESQQASAQDRGPTKEYAVGDIVKLIHNENPDVTTYLLIGPFQDTVEGPRAKAMELDENGQGITDGGTVDPDNIGEIVGHKSEKEVIRMLEKLLIDKYNDTLPRDLVERLAAETFAGSSN